MPAMQPADPTKAQKMVEERHETHPTSAHACGERRRHVSGDPNLTATSLSAGGKSGMRQVR
jgi:hypothetical protein